MPMDVSGGVTGSRRRRDFDEILGICLGCSNRNFSRRRTVRTSVIGQRVAVWRIVNSKVISSPKPAFASYKTVRFSCGVVCAVELIGCHALEIAQNFKLVGRIGRIGKIGRI